MSLQIRKCQHLEEQQKEEEDNRSIAGMNGEWPFNCEDNGNELWELKLTMAALEVQNSPDHRRRVPLPLELNCKIFECLKFEYQRKFICGLGRGIYVMFRQKVLTKSKRLRNPEQNGWKASNTRAIISSTGLLASYNEGTCLYVFAKNGFPISGDFSRTDNFPGTILYYFEVTIMTSHRIVLVGLSSGNISGGFYLYDYKYCYLSGTAYPFEWPNGAIKPEWNGQGGVLGCGLVLNPENKLSIFFTGDGCLLGKQISINPTANNLFPTASIFGNGSVEANFGLAKPFRYDIVKCPGMNLK